MITVFENKQRKVNGAALDAFQNTCLKAVEVAITSDYLDDVIKRYRDDLVVHISFVGPLRMKTINNTYRSIDRTTDVLSFPMLQMSNGKLIQPIQSSDIYIRQDGKKEIMLGDVLICFDRVCSQARQIGHSANKELFFLIIHSMLHLVGYDHINKEDEKRMCAAQREIMKNYKE